MQSNLSPRTVLKVDVDLAGPQGGFTPLCNRKKTALTLGVSDSYLSAVERAVGLTGTWLDPDEVRAWIVAHPEFRSSDVCPVQKGGSDAN